MCCDIVLLKKHCHKRLTSLDRFTFRGYHIAIFHIVSSRFLYHVAYIGDLAGDRVVDDT